MGNQVGKSDWENRNQFQLQDMSGRIKDGKAIKTEQDVKSKVDKKETSKSKNKSFSVTVAPTDKQVTGEIKDVDTFFKHTKSLEQKNTAKINKKIDKMEIQKTVMEGLSVICAVSALAIIVFGAAIFFILSVCAVPGGPVPAIAMIIFPIVAGSTAGGLLVLSGTLLLTTWLYNLSKLQITHSISTLFDDVFNGSDAIKEILKNKVDLENISFNHIAQNIERLSDNPKLIEQFKKLHACHSNMPNFDNLFTSAIENTLTIFFEEIESNLNKDEKKVIKEIKVHYLQKLISDTKHTEKIFTKILDSTNFKKREIELLSFSLPGLDINDKVLKLIKNGATNCINKENSSDNLLPSP